MFKWLRSISTAMYLLVAVSMLPALGILYYSGLETREVLQENSQREVRVLAENLASIQERITASTRQLLSTLALALEDTADLRTAGPLLARTLAENPRYTNLVLTDPQGRIIASGRDFDSQSLADRKHFKDAVASRGFSAGEYILSRTTHSPAFPFSLPSYDKSGQLRFVIIAAVKLDGVADIFRIDKLPEGSFTGLADHMGLRLFRLPAGEGALPLGQPIAPRMWQTARTSPEESGAVSQVNSDGVRRVMAFVKLRLDPGSEPYMYLFAGVPEEAITAQVRSAVRRSLGLMVLAAVLALFTAWMCSRSLLRPSVERLVQAARRFGAGDFSRPTGLDHGAGELGILAKALDQLASERSKAEQALKASQERYALVLRGANDGIWDWDVLTGRGYFSPRYKEILGFEPEEMADEVEEWKSRVHPEDLDRVIAENMRCMRGEVPAFQVRYRLRHKDGTYRWVLGRGASLKDASGRVVRMAGAHTDVTGLVEAENALRASEQQFRSILESSPMGMHFFRLDGQDRLILEAANPASDRLLGVEHASLTGRTIEEALPGLHANPVLELFRRVAMGQEQARSFEMPYSDERISRVYEMVVFRTGERAAATLFTDISERLRIQEFMVQTEKMMGVGNLAAGMAHEINNPLSGILQNVQVLARRLQEDIPGNLRAADKAGCGFDSVREYMRLRGVPESLEAIREAGSRAARIVSGMLQFSRKSDSAGVPSDLASVLDNSLELCAIHYDLKKRFDFKSIRIERRYDQDLPPVPCVETQIQQVFMNLLTNAAQAMAGMENPAIRLTVSRENGWARVDIEDNGPGIPEDVRRHVFEPFYTTKNVGEGTGLGLSVSYFIVVNHHQGRIEAERSGMGGARFTVRLPLAGRPGQIQGR